MPATGTRPGDALLATGAGVPGARHNRFMLRELGWIVGGVVAFENVVSEQLPVLER